MSRIDKLTPKQKELMLKVRNEWLDRIFSCETKYDAGKVERGIEYMYGLAGLDKPEIIKVESQLGAIMLIEVLRKSQEKRVTGSVRVSVGASVGACVGHSVWSSVGNSVGESVVESVVESVWDSVRVSVWESVWFSVRDSVRDSVGASVRDSVRVSVVDSVWSSVGNSVRDSVRVSVVDSVGESVVESVVESVWDSVRVSVVDSVWSSVGNSVKPSYSAYGNISDYCWVAQYDFLERIGVEYNCDFHVYKEMLKGGVYDMAQFKDLCIVYSLPYKLFRDEQGRLHNDAGDMAIKWRDGFGLYYIQGVFLGLKDDLYKKILSREMDLKEVMQIENIEQRMLATKYVKPDVLLKQAKAKLLDESKRGNELYKVDGLVSDTAYFLRYECPSTGRVYLSGIDPEVAAKKDADQCMAWKFGISKGEYDLLEIES